MASNRRRFLKVMLASAGIGVAGSGYWVATSRKRGARWFRKTLADTRRAVEPAPHRPNPAEWPDNAITLSWLGHATVLINFYGVRILTDPALASRVGVFLGIGTAGPKRYVAPALRVDELPKIDLILLSHAHMDHIDVPTLRRLPAGTQTLTAPLTSDVVAGGGLKNVSELRWGESTTLRFRQGELAVESFEVKHWGRRWPSELDRGYNGYILRREGKALLFGGDTAMTPLFAAVRSRGPFEAGIMPIAAYDPWIRSHCTPEEALEMANQAGADYLVPIHHQTFRLSDEPMDEPLERLREALEAEPERLALRDVGETFVCPAA